MTHHDAGIELRSISRLLKDDKGNRAHYRVPAYQRGYRWTKRQVTELLDDIWEFIQTSGEKLNSTFYCLQPIVVRAEADGSFEVVDGQQRLTTIYILLTCLKDMMAILRKESFRISFETRSTSETFLKNIDPSRADENVDFHHICEARLTIQNWLDARDGSHAFKFFQHLLSDDEVGKNVKVIWYQLAPQEDPVAAFTRLNVGKIPLTEAELVRALFLRSAQRDDPTGTLALRIAYEWDQVEQNLQDDAFWYFIQNVDAPDNNRIGILFRLAADIADGPVHPGDHRVFFHFSERLAARGTAEHAWLAIKRIHQALEEWYEDRALFHVLGYLIRQDGSLRRLTGC